MIAAALIGAIVALLLVIVLAVIFVAFGLHLSTTLLDEWENG
ncbi:hypothetical protein [Sphingomonas sp. TX0522]|nr:hypothetical protein [Sphingomonas sp. TX0522]